MNHIDTAILWLMFAGMLLTYTSITLYVNRQLKGKGGVA